MAPKYLFLVVGTTRTGAKKLAYGQTRDGAETTLRNESPFVTLTKLDFHKYKKVLNE